MYKEHGFQWFENSYQEEIKQYLLGAKERLERIYEVITFLSMYSEMDTAGYP